MSLMAHVCELAELYMFFFFFFQAEDGIRDYKVTGVQTCALPISRRDFRGLDLVLERDLEQVQDVEGTVHLRSEEHTSELQSPCNLVCRLLLEKKKNDKSRFINICQVYISS